MSFDKETIKQIIEIIRNSDVENKEEHFEHIYQNFKKKYPVLYSACCKNTFDMKTLNYMLDMLDKIHNNEQSQEQASIEVGQKLFSKFVDMSKLKSSDKPIEGGPKIVMK